MMRLNEFEKHIRKTMGDHEEHVNIASLMQNIPPVLVKRKKKMFFFFLAGTILLSSSFIGYSIISNSSSLDIANLNSVQQSKNLDLTTQLNVDLIPKSIIASNIIENQTTNLQTKESKIVNNKTTTKPNALIVSTIINSNNKEINVNKRYSPLEEQVDIVNSSDDNLSNDFSSKASFLTNNVTFAQDRDQEFQYTNLLNTDEISILSLNYLENKKLNRFQKKAQNVECPEFSENPWVSEIGMVMGLSRPNKSLQAQQEIYPAITSRTENEKSLEGLDLEFFISAKRARWPVFLKTGVNYSRWSERMKINESFTEIDTVQGVTDVTVSQNGDTITYIYGDIFIEKDKTIKKNIHYYLNRIDIPLSVVFEHEFGNHAIQAELGARINLSTFARGQVYNDNGEFVPAKNSTYFRKLTGMSYFGKFHYRYYVGKTFVGTQIYYQFLPAEFSNNELISQKYSNIGIGVYAGYRF